MEKFKSIMLFLVALVLVLLAGPVVFVFQLVRKKQRKEDINKYIHSLAISLDQLGGTLLYGYEDWTISSIAYFHSAYENKNHWFMKFINFLFQDELHCKNSYKAELKERGNVNPRGITVSDIDGL